MHRTNISQQRYDELKTQLWESGAIGGIEGTIFGLLSGWYIMHGYNHGKNTRFFALPNKVLYVVSWCAAGIVFSTNLEKTRIKKQLIREHQARREMFIEAETAATE